MRTLTEIIIFKIMVFYKHTNVKIIRNKYYFYTLNRFTKSKSLSNLQAKKWSLFCASCCVHTSFHHHRACTAFPHSCIFGVLLSKLFIYKYLPTLFPKLINYYWEHECQKKAANLKKMCVSFYNLVFLTWYSQVWLC